MRQFTCSLNGHQMEGSEYQSMQQCPVILDNGLRCQGTLRPILLITRELLENARFDLSATVIAQIVRNHLQNKETEATDGERNNQEDNSNG